MTDYIDKSMQPTLDVEPLFSFHFTPRAIYKTLEDSPFELFNHCQLRLLGQHVHFVSCEP